MLPLHTQKSLDALTWNEVQKIHSSLGLKATATTRTRRDYQKRIVAAMPQPVVEPEHTVTPLTCATCPLARHINGNRYCCGLTDAVVRGHWEAKTDCYTEVALTQVEEVTAETPETVVAITEIAAPEPTALLTVKRTISNHPFRYRWDIYQGAHSFSSSNYGMCECSKCVPNAVIEHTPAASLEIATTTEIDSPPNRGDNGRNRVTSILPMPVVTIASIPYATKPKANDSFMTAFTNESEGDRKFNDLTYLSQLELEAQLAIERTEIGSEEEAIAYRHLRAIEQDIAFYCKARPEPQCSPVITQLETQMKQLKSDVFKVFKIVPFDQGILPCDPEQLATSPEPEGTIHWIVPQKRGTIVGKKGATRQFYFSGADEIFIVISADFTASETKHENVRHRQIRAALEAGRVFDPISFKRSSNFQAQTEDCGTGRIMQGSDGRWWAWKNDGITGHPFLDEETARSYLKACGTTNRKSKQFA